MFDEFRFSMKMVILILKIIYMFGIDYCNLLRVDLMSIHCLMNFDFSMNVVSLILENLEYGVGVCVFGGGWFCFLIKLKFLDF